ncbi:malectin domain-containing carbohydrate-binding protein [Pseudozobellia sp. WGM2]|uniref:malectin domain-containing carbohydrate-binding protein n=1 Tax=Pseudozobellia sp. WGM2 TaxID=2787625 RepID=UPI001ADFF86C|nr:malectin domain-containing carbohydrate-binding protein [Pseudozobellia sp. WGM2]
MKKVLLFFVFLSFSFSSLLAQNSNSYSDFALRINSGGSESNYSGLSYSNDFGYDSGSTLRRSQTGLPEPYQSFRYSRSQQMGYDIPLEDGEYTVNLHFAELWFGATGGGSGGVGSRVFDVNIEGVLVENNLDVFAEVGAENILVKSYSVIVSDGKLNIDFDSRNEVGGERHPIINAIEILGIEEDDEENMRPFITTWKTDNPGSSSDNQIMIPTNPNEHYFYSVSWGDGTTDDGVTGDITHTYAQQGTYQVAISGNFPSITFGMSGIGDRDKIIDIVQWGDITWQTFESSFLGCRNMSISAVDSPNLSQVKSLNKAFYRAASLPNNGHFTNWDVSNIEDMSELFSETSFNQDISNWDIGKVKTTYAMFYQTPFNQYIGNWDTSSLEYMRQMFMGSQFNQYIGNWDVSKVRNFEQMFTRTPFNQNIGGWDMSSATDIRSMFQNTPFNQDIGNWDVGKVERMAYLFENASSFNQDIGSWNVANVKYAQGMFRDAISFNQDLSNWNTQSLIIAQQMFKGSNSFNQDLGSWNIENVTDMRDMFTGITLSLNNYDSILNNWSSQNVQSSVEFGGGNSQYCESQEARQSLKDNLGWVLVDGGKIDDCDLSNPNVDFALRFNTGGDHVVNDGDNFLADNNFVGSSNVLKRPQTGLPEPYQSFRYSRSQQMGYDIPLEDGEYTVNLYFAELWFGATGGGSGGVGSRVFDVKIENELREDNLDVFAEVGAETVLSKRYTVTVSDGVLDIDFSALEEDGGNRHPILNAIEILGQQVQTEELALEAIPNLTNDINSEIDLNIIVSGGNPNEGFVFAISGQPDGLTIDPSSGRLSGIIDEAATRGGENKNGIHDVKITVSQQGSADVSTFFSWTITNPSCEWTELADSNIERFEGVSQKIGNKLYVLGGFKTGIKVVPETEIYNVDTNEWQIGASMPLPVTHTAAVATGDEIWLVGGFAGDNPGVATDLVQIYNVLTDTWRMGPKLPREMGSGAVALLGNKIYHFGGLLPDRKTVVGDHMVLDLTNEENGWSNLKPMPEPRNHHSGIALNGLVYAIGGQVGHDGPRYDTKFVHAYNPETDEWTRLTDLARPRSHFKGATTWHNGKIIITGGVENGEVIGDISEYDSKTNQWKEICKLPGNGLEEAAVQSFDDHLIVAGGRPITHSNTIIDQTISMPLSTNLMLAPMASAGPDLDVNLSQNNIVIQGAGNDPDGGFVVYQWSQISGPNSAILNGSRSNELNVSGLTIGSYVFRVTVMDDENDMAFDTVTVNVSGEDDFVLNVNAGGDTASYDNKEFIEDTYYSTGSTLYRPQTGLPEPYSTFRYSRSQQMSYDIPLENGEYDVNLYFAELWFGATGGGSGGAGKRVFDVSIEGNLAEDNLDIYAEVGAEAILVKSHTVVVSDGVLNIGFDSRDAVGGKRHPIINAIEIKGTSNSSSAKENNSKTQPTNFMAKVNEMNLYPNQASEIVYIYFNQETTVSSIAIYDMSGRLLESFQPNSNKLGDAYAIDVSLYPKGQYLIKTLDRNGKSYTEILMVQH